MSIVKFLLNTAIAGAVAGGVYHYLDQNARKNAANAEDPDAAPRTLDKANIKDAADRAYTSIVHGTEEVTATIKRSVGPQGEQIMNDVQDAAGKVQETMTYAGKKVGAIVTDSDSTVQEKASAVADTVRYAAVDIHDKIRQTLNAAQPSEFEEETEDDTSAIVAEAYEVTPAESEEVSEAATEDDDPDIEVEFYVDDKAETAEQTEGSAPAVEVFVDTDAAVSDVDTAASVEMPAETAPTGAAAPAETVANAGAEPAAETVAEPVADAAQIEEFFDDEDAN